MALGLRRPYCCFLTVSEACAPGRSSVVLHTSKLSCVCWLLAVQCAVLCYSVLCCACSPWPAMTQASASTGSLIKLVLIARCKCHAGLEADLLATATLMQQVVVSSVLDQLPLCMHARCQARTPTGHLTCCRLLKHCCSAALMEA